MSKSLTGKIRIAQAFGYYTTDGALIETSLTNNELRKVLSGLKGSKISTRPNSKIVIEEVYSDYVVTKNQKKEPTGRRVTFDEIISADQTNIHFLKDGLYPSSNPDRSKCDYGLSNNTYAPRIAELIRRTIKENLIDLPPEIRILPMTINSATHKNCHSVKDLQDKFFLGLLPSRERNGRYLYTRRKINSKPGAVILFQANSSIIASAEYIGIQPLKKSVEGYNGYMVFDVNSIQVFDPIYHDEMRECWPKFNKFSQAFQKLDPDGYPQFLKMLNGIKSPQGNFFAEKAIEISNPPEEVELNKPQEIFSLSTGDIVSKRNLYDLIQYSKVKSSRYWGGEDFIIGNTPQQGINWIGKLPAVKAVIIKTRPGVYDEDGWSDESKEAYHYSFKARNSVVSFGEKANKVLIGQPQYFYPIFLFTECAEGWKFEEIFSVVEIEDKYVVLKRGIISYTEIITTQDNQQFKEGGRRYVTHLMAERNMDVVKAVKESNSWECEICGINFQQKYGVSYIEAHHKIPISTYSSRYIVKPEDLVLLCPNCHKTVHIFMKDKDMEYEEIKSVLSKARDGQ